MVSNHLIHQKMITKGSFYFKREMSKLQRVLNNLAKVNQLTNGRGGSQTQVGVEDGVEEDLTPLHFSLSS